MMQMGGFSREVLYATWMALVLLTTGLYMLFSRPRQQQMAKRKNLLASSRLKQAVNRRPFQFVLQAPAVLLYLLIIAAGLWGVQNSSRNPATVITWSIWWTGIIFTFLLMGRFWCLICPFAAIGDWVQRMTFWGKREETLSMGLKWPAMFRNLYPPALTFLLFTWIQFRFGLITNPMYTAYLAIGMIFLAVAMGLIFEKKAFCRYLCPVGGLMGLYSTIAPTELRVKDRQICRSCRGKDCIRGNEKGYGCPVHEYPGTMQNNTYCILCTECIKTCPHDNLAFNLRPPAAELMEFHKHRLDEALLAQVIMGITLLHAVSMTPIWDSLLLRLSNLTGFLRGYSAVTALMIMSAGILPLILIISAALLKLLVKTDTVKIFAWMAYPLIAIALFMHLAHNSMHILMEGGNILPVLSDPFGWGWNIFGTAAKQFSPLLSHNKTAIIQVFFVLAGQAVATAIVMRTSPQNIPERQRGWKFRLVPLIMLVLVNAVNLWLLSLPMVMRMG